MRYIEVVPPPAEVDIEFYAPESGHVAVAPASHHEDARVVGVTYTGLAKEQTYVRLGDAVITYPDGTVFVKTREDALAFFAPVDDGVLKLSADNDAEGSAAAEALGLKKTRRQTKNAD